MKPLSLTRTSHYLVRARQRGYRPEDLAIIERLGNFGGDGILLRKKDVAPEIERLSTTLRGLRRRRANAKFQRVEFEVGEGEIARKIKQLQRLSGSYIPIESGHALSIYRPSKRRAEHILRGRRLRGQQRRHRI
jgi:hypothetical protein